MRVTGLSRLAFAATLIGLGLYGLVTGELSAIWQAVPDGLPGQPILAYVCAVVSLASGLGLLLRRMAAPAARLLLVYLLLWFLLSKAPFLVLKPAENVSWENAAESVVVVAAAWTLYSGLAADWDRRRLGFAVGDRGLAVARALYGLAMIEFGLAHFFYLAHTAELVPGWLPARAAWADFTGAAYIAAGVAMLFGVFARLAATLSALQMGLFTLFVWAPVLAAGSKDASDWGEGVVSWTLTAAGWVAAESYRGAPWLGVSRRRGLSAQR